MNPITNDPSGFVVILSIEEWLDQLTQSQINAIETLYHRHEELIHNLGMSIISGIEAAYKSKDKEILARIHYFIEEEQEYIYTLLDLAFPDPDQATSGMAEEYRKLTMEAVQEFFEMYVEDFYREVQEFFLQHPDIVDDNTFECMILSDNTIGFKITPGEKLL